MVQLSHPYMTTGKTIALILWTFVGRTDAEAEASVFWLSDVNSQHIEKSLMLEKIEGRRRKSYRMR